MVLIRLRRPCSRLCRVVLFVASLAAASWPSLATAQRAVFLVRHAEKQDSTADPPLSAKGRKQADALALRLKDAGVSAIYTSQFARTKQTAKPLGDRLSAAGIAVKEESIPLPPALMAAPDNPARLDDYAKSIAGHMRDHHADDVILIVGHDNTVPAIIKALGHKTPIVIAPSEFDRLFLVTPRAIGDSRAPGLLHFEHY